MNPGLLVHYGHSSFNVNEFKQIQNESYWIKPKGGLWTSPLNSEYGWKDWNESEMHCECSDDNCFILELNDYCRILVIDSFDDLDDCVSIQYPHYNTAMDFELLQTKYDAIWLTYRGQIDTRYSQPNLYGWDCETVLILNPNCCKQVKYETNNQETT